MARIATDPTDIATLSVHLARAFPTLSAYSAAYLSSRLHALERKVRRDAEASRNEPRTEKQEQRAANGIRHATARWLAAVAEYASLAPDGSSMSARIAAATDARVRIETQGDHRGCVLLLTLPGHSTGAVRGLGIAGALSPYEETNHEDHHP